MWQPHGLDQLKTGDSRRSGAIDNKLDIFEITAGEIERIDQSGSGNNGCAVLIIVKDRYVHQFAQLLLDDETVGRLDVLEIDAAKGGPEIAHAIDERIDI